MKRQLPGHAAEHNAKWRTGHTLGEHRRSEEASVHDEDGTRVSFDVFVPQ